MSTYKLVKTDTPSKVDDVLVSALTGPGDPYLIRWSCPSCECPMSHRSPSHPLALRYRELLLDGTVSGTCSLCDPTRVIATFRGSKTAK